MAKFNRNSTKKKTEYTQLQWAVYYTDQAYDKSYSKEDILKSILWTEAQRQTKTVEDSDKLYLELLEHYELEDD